MSDCCVMCKLLLTRLTASASRQLHDAYTTDDIPVMLTIDVMLCHLGCPKEASLKGVMLPVVYRST